MLVLLKRFRFGSNIHHALVVVGAIKRLVARIILSVFFGQTRRLFFSTTHAFKSVVLFTRRSFLQGIVKPTNTRY